MHITCFTTKNGLEITLGNLDLLVGSNNVGKYRFLKDKCNIIKEGKVYNPVIISIVI
jgi:hypothetical protein